MNAAQPGRYSSFPDGAISSMSLLPFHESHDDPCSVRLSGFPTPVDVERISAREELDVVVSRFADELRRGRKPDVAVYLARHPELAAELAELLPLIATLERWGSDKETECVRTSIPADFPLQQIGDYRLVREVGRGGGGVVFEAVQNATGRRVALKLLPYRVAADLPQRQARFRQEAATIAGLRHRNIVPVYAFGQHQGYCYYVMQYVSGVNLDWLIRRLRETTAPVRVAEVLRAAGSDHELSTLAVESSLRGVGRQSWPAFAKIGLQVAQALSYAHRRGVLHNDIKPGNLLLAATGQVVVTDFSVGLQPEDAPADDDVEILGTLRYMAPERFFDRPDPRSDLYSLGMTLYELITRTPAHAAADRQRLIQQVLQTPLLPPGDRVPDVPDDLAAIVLKAAAKEPRDRYPSADALRVDLLKFLRRRPAAVRSSNWFGRFADWWRRPSPPQ